MVEYNKINYLTESYLKSNFDGMSSENFCVAYMNLFFDLSDELENELEQPLFEILDNINLVCDSYEKDVNIRMMDKFCIGEVKLQEKIKVLYNKFKCKI